MFTTTERPDLSATIRVAYTPHQLSSFSRDILFISLYESCKHRPSAIRDATNLAQQVINRLLACPLEPGLVTRDQIVVACIAALKPFDAAAATMYAAYHPLPAHS